MEPVAGWIPPEFREFVYEEFNAADLEILQQTVRVKYPGQQPRQLTPDEISQSGIRKVVAVRDARNGELHQQLSATRFVTVPFNGDDDAT